MKKYKNFLLPVLLILIGASRPLLCALSRFLPGLNQISGAWPTLSFVFWILLLGGILWLFSLSLPADTADFQPLGERKEARADGWFGKTLAFLRIWRVELLILAVSALSLSMLIHSGYYWDDAVNSTVYLSEKYDELPLLQNVLIFMRKYIELGRINVLSFYYYFFFLIENVSVYKALIIALVLADQLMLRAVLLKLGVPKKYAQACMLLIPLLIQLRAYQDPVSGFYGLMQVILLELLLSVFFLLRWLEGGKRRDLLLSLGFFGVGLMTYEVCYPFILMIFLLIWLYRRDFWKAVRGALPYALMILVMLGLIFLVRLQYTQESTYVGVAFNLDIGAILHAALCQITAALPLSFYSAGHELAIVGTSYLASEVMNYDFSGFLADITVLDALLAALCLWLLHLIGRERGQNWGTHACGGLCVLGFGFWLLPAITVSLSQRYQGQLFAGLGYLPVYLQYFGVAMLLCLLWQVLWKRASVILRRGLICLGSSVFLIMMLLNLQNNREVTRLMNHAFYDPRAAGEAALTSGLLDFLPDGARLLSANDETYVWEADWGSRGLYQEYYRIYSGREVNAFGIFDYVGQLSDGKLPAEHITAEVDGSFRAEPENLYLIAYDGDSARGMTKLAHVRAIRVNLAAHQILEAQTDQMIYFISGRYPDYASVSVMRHDEGLLQISAAEAQRVRETDSGILFQLDPQQTVDFESLRFSDFAR